MSASPAECTLAALSPIVLKLGRRKRRPVSLARPACAAQRRRRPAGERVPGDGLSGCLLGAAAAACPEFARASRSV